MLFCIVCCFFTFPRCRLRLCTSVTETDWAMDRDFEPQWWSLIGPLTKTGTQHSCSLWSRSVILVLIAWMLEVPFTPSCVRHVYFCIHLHFPWQLFFLSNIKYYMYPDTAQLIHYSTNTLSISTLPEYNTRFLPTTQKWNLRSFTQFIILYIHMIFQMKI